jgi:nifR3 family TIM-barrel protein
MSNKLEVGGVEIPGRVWIAPMTGISDLPFRETATALGAPYVATEMVASAEFARGRPDVVRRAAVGEGLPLTVIQLVGRDIAFMAQGARMAQDAGAEIIDLNFGCPAKEVAAGAACGSALMREPDLAEALVAAAVEAVDVPVTVKMRLGNAPEIAARAEAVGAKAITVHGRTRNQFYKGVADWTAVAAVKKAVSIPVLVNGDIVDGDTARRALEQSGADGVMIGRGVYGRPWIAGAIEAALDGRGFVEPDAEERLAIALTHFRRSLDFYGERLGLKMFRKHLASYIEAAPWPDTAEERRAARAALCRLEDPAAVEAALRDLWLAGGRLAA